MIKEARFLEIKILNKLRNFITPLSKEEKELLKQGIITEGCREALIVWDRRGERILVDGHHRFEICKKHDIPFNVITKKFKNIDEAQYWMIINQLGRRNLTTDQLSYYRGLKYLSLRNKKGGYQNVESKGRIEPLTSEKLAEEFNTSGSTIKRDAKFALGLNKVGESNSKLKEKILNGEVRVKKSDIQLIGQARGEVKIKNEADLYNKAKNIRNEILIEVEESIKQIEEKRIETAREIIKDAEPVFVEKEDRLNRIKGMIISAMNRAIKEKDIAAFQELKKLIDKLGYEVFEIE